MGTTRTDGLYQQAKAASADLSVPALLALDKRVVLAQPLAGKGLGSGGARLSELQYWDRLWGQQGLRVPFATRPFRAARCLRARADLGRRPPLALLGRSVQAVAQALHTRAGEGRGFVAVHTFDCARVAAVLFAALIPLVEGRARQPSACVPEGMKRTSTTDAPLARGDEQQQGQQQSREIGDGMDAPTAWTRCPGRRWRRVRIFGQAARCEAIVFP